MDYDWLVRQVLDCYPIPLRVGTVRRLGNRGGFSGAALFYCDNPNGPLCLREWPESEAEPTRLAWLHRLMAAARDAGLAFVPRVYPASDGRTFIPFAGRLWELQEWMPGRADFHDQPTMTRLENACSALARLHEQWAGMDATEKACPAVQRRFDRLRRWQAFAATNTLGYIGNVALVAQRAERALGDWLPELRLWLEPWAARSFRVHPCLCDVWHDHVLFEGDRVTGIIDYGAVKVDHPAVDLARMLGSLIEDDETAWQIGLTAYRRIRSFTEEEERLARVLDRSGVVLGISNWLRWLSGDEKTVEDVDAALRRLERLARRVERWPLAAER